jgi:hypothetical protein
MKQLDMFPAGEDLPLFTGTPVKITIQNPVPRYDCLYCLDRGLLDDGTFCVCSAGEKLHRRAAPSQYPDYQQGPPEEEPCQT